MSKPFSDFYGLLALELNGCAYPVIDFNLREVAREFCCESSVWKAGVTPISTVAGQASYVLETPDPLGAIHRITKITVNGVLLWSYRAAKGICPKYTVDNPPFRLSADLLTVTLCDDEIPANSALGGMVVEVALQPASDTTALPDFLHTQYSEAIRKGTLSRLMMMHGQEWSNPTLGIHYSQGYQNQLAFAANEGQTGNVRQVLRVKKWG